MPAQDLVQPSFLTPQRWQRFKTVAAKRQLNVSLVAENIVDPHNISAMMRSADAFGIQYLEAIGQGEGFSGHPKTSSSAREWLTVRAYPNTAECFSRLRSEGKRIFVTRLDPNANSIYDVDWTAPCAIVLGNEHAGVSAEAAAQADEEIYIPMVGMVQSFNVSVAAAIVLSELFRQRNKAGLYGEQRRENNNILLAEWIAKEARNKGVPWTA